MVINLHWCPLHVLIHCVLFSDVNISIKLGIKSASIMPSLQVYRTFVQSVWCQCFHHLSQLSLFGIRKLNLNEMWQLSLAICILLSTNRSLVFALQYALIFSIQSSGSGIKTFWYIPFGRVAIICVLMCG